MSKSFRPSVNPKSIIVDSAVQQARRDAKSVLELAIPKDREIADHTTSILREPKVKPSYNRSRDSFVVSKDRENTRFYLNQFSKKSLSVEEEEEIRIETEVQKRVEAKLNELSKRIEEEANLTGFKKGFEEGQAQAQQEARPLIEELNVLLGNMDNTWAKLLEDNESFVIRFIYFTVKRILMKEVAQDQEFIKKTIVTVLERINSKDNIKIFLCERDFTSLEKLKGELDSQVMNMKNITFEKDPRIEMGGCRIETEFGNIDASLEAQLKNLDELLIASK